LDATGRPPARNGQRKCAFEFTIFLFIMVPIAKEFDVPLTAVAAVFTITLWLRLVGATASGWLEDRVGRKIPLMISILW
jgi:MFS transporter, SHS family, lactate transporter